MQDATFSFAGSFLPGDRLMALLRQTETLQAALQRNMNNTLFVTRFCACLRQAAGR